MNKLFKMLLAVFIASKSIKAMEEVIVLQNVETKKIEVAAVVSKDSKPVREISDFGQMYYLGLGVKKNIPAAIKCFEWQAKIAKKPKAQAEAWYFLGEIFLFGPDDIVKDIPKALEYLERAAQQTACKVAQSHANRLLGCYYFQEVNYEKPVNEGRAYNYLINACKENVDPHSYFESNLILGMWYNYCGNLSPKNYTRARAHLKKAANQDIFPEIKAKALYFIGELYLQGLEVTQKPKKAKECFLIAAHQNDDPFTRAGAQWKLGEILLTEYPDQPIDSEKGLACLNQAMNQTDNPVARRGACAKLGYEYFRGKRIKQDIERATKLWSWVVRQRGTELCDYKVRFWVAMAGVEDRDKFAKDLLISVAQQKVSEALAHDAKMLLEEYYA